VFKKGAAKGLNHSHNDNLTFDHPGCLNRRAMEGAEYFGTSPSPEPLIGTWACIRKIWEISIPHCPILMRSMVFNPSCKNSSIIKVIQNPL
jgi:hypothetical protein